MDSMASERLAAYACELRFEDLPTPVVAKVKDHLAYNLALALSGHLGSGGPIGVRLAYALSEGGGAATIVGAHRTALPLDAVFANAALICGPFDDTSEPSGAHPGVVIFPAAWAIGERGRVGGKEMLTAVVVGYDVMCKLADPISGFGSYARRPNHGFAPFGVAATAGRLMGFDPQRMAQAMGHAAHAGMGVVEDSTNGWHVQARLARAGVFSAKLAGAGASTAPTTIEGDHGFYRAFYGAVPEQLGESLDTLGREFAILETTTKEFAASGSNIPPMLATLDACAAHDLTPADIADVRVVVAEERRSRDAYFERGIDANPLGSLRVRIAGILLDRRIDESRAKELNDPEMQQMLAKVRLDYEQGHVVRVFQSEAPSTIYGRVEITTTDGRSLVRERDRYMAPPGDWNAWLRRDGRRLLSEERLARLLDLVTRIEELEDVSELFGAARADIDRYR